MIFIKSLKWSNWFSYGENNYIDLASENLLQIMGANGVGKTSIPLIIEEILFSKNSKGIKKQSLPNRVLDNPTVSATIEFSKDGKDYIIKVTRKSTAKVVLLENGIDISSHTATNTYKTIQKIIGMDFKTFSQLIYQSSKSNLEFLTATDTNRKKFLIGLFGLDSYTKIHLHFSSELTKVNAALDQILGKVSTYEAWIKDHSYMDTKSKPLQDIPTIDSNDVEELNKLNAQVLNISKDNAAINKNNQYKALLDKLDTSILSEDIIVDTEKKKEAIDKGSVANTKAVECSTRLKDINAKLIKLSKLSGTCPSCLQEISEDIRSAMTQELKDQAKELKAAQKEATEIANYNREVIKRINESEKRRELQEKVEDDLVTLQNQIDNELPEEILNPKELSNKIFEIKERIDTANNNIKRITLENKKAEAHNAKVEVIKNQLATYTSELADLNIELDTIQNTKSKLDIIKKAFGTNGLVSYKIEYLVKDLEYQINEYLGELSRGRFLLKFILKGDKLNIDIIDNGVTIAIEELSAGELARINASTLLAIRKLMAAISSSKINILFLDEVMGVLDEEGKEGLIDVLRKEKELNTLLVSHEYSHPLIPKITIEKTDNISRINEQ